MDSNQTKVCCLCLETSDDSVSVVEKFQNSTISSILAKHFWFQVDENDLLCQVCWIQTKTFHDFYMRIEIRHGKYHSSNDYMIGADRIKRERSVSPTEEAFELDLDIIKYEETEPEIQVPPELLLCKDEDSTHYNDDQSIF